MQNFPKIKYTKTETQADYHHLTCKVDAQFRNTLEVLKYSKGLTNVKH